MSKSYILLIFFPVLIFIELMAFSWIASLMREPSDMAVFAGVLSICGFLSGNYFLIKFIYTLIKSSKCEN
jgi:hypothetical protein